MTLRDRLLHYPQSIWLRKALFQVHLWVGLILALYVLMMCVTGTILIYRRSLSVVLSVTPHIVAAGPRLTSDELAQIAERAHPGYQADQVSYGRRANDPAKVSLERGSKKLQRLFDPYTGSDLGDALTWSFRALLWMVELHDNLLAGTTGQRLNGLGGILVTVLCISGMVIWWPGIEKWRRSLFVNWKANPQRLNWSLHTSLGFWSLAFILMWGISGIYLGFPAPFNALVDYLDGPETRQLRWGDQVLAWLARLHFGRFPSLTLEITWTIFGLIPVVLLITGALMWWNRVLGPWYRRNVAEKNRATESWPAHPENSTAVYNSRRASSS
jgi:uncharacterized iron-regulated membrane protein